jgi:SAM-dependent methyltransferase
MNPSISAAQVRDYSELYKLGGRKFYGRAGEFRAAQPRKSVLYAKVAGAKTLLDVGCGRGWMLDYAESLGLNAYGLEIVPELCKDPRVRPMKSAESLPVNAQYDIVTCLDVLEHLAPEQVDDAIEELHRVSERFIVLSIPHWPCPWNGIETHLSVHPRSWWEKKLARSGKHLTNKYDDRYRMSHILIESGS